MAAAGTEHRRIYDLRHTYVTWSLAAGVDIPTLARADGDPGEGDRLDLRAPRHGADVYEHELLDAFDEGRSGPVERHLDVEAEADAA